MGGVLAAATEALLPGMCPHCDQPLQGKDRGLCGTCWAMVLPRAGASCPRCGGPVDDDSESCLECARSAPPQRATVLLFYRHELGCQEIARILQLPPATVKSHLHRARARLRDLLEPMAQEDWGRFRNLAERAG
jgi:transposase-like protein